MIQPAKNEAEWFAVRTKSRSEKAVLRLLQDKGIRAYLPILSTERIHGAARRRRVYLPLIPGYIFVKIVLAEYIQVLQTEHVVDFVRFGSELNAVTEEEISVMEKICQSTGCEIVVGAGSYQRGDLVEVITGPLRGVKGRLVTVQGQKNLVVELRNVGQALHVVHMEPRHVRRLHGVRT